MIDLPAALTVKMVRRMTAELVPDHEGNRGRAGAGDGGREDFAKLVGRTRAVVAEPEQREKPLFAPQPDTDDGVLAPSARPAVAASVRTNMAVRPLPEPALLGRFAGQDAGMGDASVSVDVVSEPESALVAGEQMHPLAPAPTSFVPLDRVFVEQAAGDGGLQVSVAPAKGELVNVEPVHRSTVNAAAVAGPRPAFVSDRPAVVAPAAAIPFQPQAPVSEPLRQGADLAGEALVGLAGRPETPVVSSAMVPAIPQPVVAAGGQGVAPLGPMLVSAAPVPVSSDFGARVLAVPNRNGAIPAVVRITLRPAELGPVQVVVHTSADATQVRIVAETEAGYLALLARSEVLGALVRDLRAASLLPQPEGQDQPFRSAEGGDDRAVADGQAGGSGAHSGPAKQGGAKRGAVPSGTADLRSGAMNASPAEALAGSQAVPRYRTI